MPPSAPRCGPAGEPRGWDANHGNVHPDVFTVFEEICRRRGAAGDVLEVGAMPTDDTLLRLPCLRDARFRIGVNPEGPWQCDGFSIVRGHGSDMRAFPDRRFDTVVCNSTLEHDPRFWETLREIRRVLRPGGLFVVGVPGYLPGSIRPFLSGSEATPLPAWVDATTPVLAHHDAPGDFYRFSAQAVASVFMEGMRDVEMRAVMVPPRLVASGFSDGVPLAPDTRQRGIAQLDALAARLAPLGPPIVVFNKSHSGSRLLARVLAEAGVFMGARLNDSEDALDVLRLVEHYLDFHHPDDEAFRRNGDPALDALVMDVFSAHLRGARPGQPWGWKLSETHFALPLIARLFPRARFIHLVRDGRDVAFSNFNAPDTDRLRKIYFGTDRLQHWRGLPLTAAAYAAAPHLFNAQLWVASVTDARLRGQMLGERYREVRYEDLTLRFAETVSELFAWLGLGDAGEVVTRLAHEVRVDSVGKFRDVDSRRRAEALAVLGPTLAAFGYGDDAEPASDEARPALSVVVLRRGDGEDGLRHTLHDLSVLAMLRPDVVVVTRGTGSAQQPADGAWQTIDVPAKADEADAAAAGLAVARGRFVLFARAGDRFTQNGLPLLLRDAQREHAIAAAGRAVCGPQDAMTPLIVHQDGLAHCDALPIGSVIYRADDAVILGAQPDAETPRDLWHWNLLLRASRHDLLLLTDHQLCQLSAPFTPRILPVPSAPSPTDSDTAQKRILVYGPPGASFDLLMDGLPDDLRRLVHHAPQLDREADLARLVHASVVLVLRDFARPLNDGTLDALRTLGIPFHYVADDHLPTLRDEMPWVFGDSTIENLAAFLRQAESAAGASPALTEALRPLARKVWTWLPLLDQTLIAQTAAESASRDTWRVGVMGGEFRAQALQSEILPALRAMAQNRPTLLVARAGLLPGPPGLPYVEVPFDSSFRRFVFIWRRQRPAALVHPTGQTANAPYKNANALLVGLYVGAVPIVSGADPAYAALPDDCGALVVRTGGLTWREALEQTADPATCSDRLAQLRAWCERAFTDPQPAETLRAMLAASPPVTDAVVEARRARLAT